MAPRSEITLGFVGSGKVEKKNANALLTDLIDASGGHAKFVLPMTKGFWNEALVVVSDYAIDHGIPVEAIVDDTTSKMREVKHLLSAARKQHSSANVPAKMASLLDEAREGSLIVLWDDEDEGSMDAVRASDEKGITLLELTRGLDRIELVADDEEPEEPEVEEDETEAVAEDDQEPDEDVVEDEPEEEEPDEEPEVEDDDEPEAEDEFPEPEAEDDFTEAAEDEEPEEFTDEDEPEEPVAEDEPEDEPEPEEELVAAAPAGMTEFQTKVLAVLEGAAATLAAATEAIAAVLVPTPAPAIESKAAAKKATAPAKATRAPRKATKPAPEPEPEEEPEKPVRRAAAAKKVAPPVKKATPRPEPETVKRTVPRRSSEETASTNGEGSMTKAQAQKIMDSYRPKRGRPPADVTEARKVLGLM